MTGTHRSLHRIFEILELLASKPGGLLLSEILRLLGSPPKSSVYTLLQQMIKHRYLTYFAQEKVYKIGPAFIKLSACVLAEHTVHKSARHTMEKLARLTGEDVYLGIRDGNRLVYIDKVEGNQSISLNIHVGASRYLHGSCIGKLLMAYLLENEQRQIIKETGLPALSKKTITKEAEYFNELKKIKEESVSVTNEESMDGVIGIAAPIRNHHNQVVAGICISAPVSRVSLKKDELVLNVREAANEISNQLGAESDE
jgi:IclR family KDG regulon transcriptional repressor